MDGSGSGILKCLLETAVEAPEGAWFVTKVSQWGSDANCKRANFKFSNYSKSLKKLGVSNGRAGRAVISAGQ